MNYYSGTSSTASTMTFSGTVFLRVAPAPPRPKPLPMELVDRVWNSAALLDLDLPLHSKDQVERARRALAKRHHPDLGGSVEMMQEINAAADFLLTGFQ